MVANKSNIKHWKAYIKVLRADKYAWQYEATVAASSEYEAIDLFRKKYGQNCIIGWIKETKLYGLQSVSY
jgi:hypothetical protein